ncbi:MAG: zf-HC2 domain-containing protein [Gemmatimonadaceae bacterium]|jgi:hypothetical protein|nr:zf-HC2 domain-containing protein [Gemmatimonadaceae bacterium]
MTDPQGDIRPPEAPVAMDCAQVTAMLPAYARGTLPDAASRALERHAADCAACGVVLDGQGADAPPSVTLDALVAAHPLSMVERAALRRDILGRVAPRRWSRRARTVAVLGAMAAALAVIVVRFSGAPDRDAEPGLRVIDGHATSGSGATVVTSAPMAAAERLARAYAAPAFAELDTAAREVEQAMRAAPDDGALRAFRVALDDRRRELESRVARVSE